MKDLSEYVYKTERAFRKPTVERTDQAMSPDYRRLSAVAVGESLINEWMFTDEIMRRLEELE